MLRTEVKQNTEAEQLKRHYCQVMVTIAQQIPASPTIEQIKAASFVIPHLVEASQSWLDWVQDENLIWVFTGLGWFYQGQGAYAQAAPWLEQGRDVVCDRMREEHPDVATCLNNLGSPQVLVKLCQNGDKSHRRESGYPDSPASQPRSFTISELRTRSGTATSSSVCRFGSTDGSLSRMQSRCPSNTQPL